MIDSNEEIIGLGFSFHRCPVCQGELFYTKETTTAVCGTCLRKKESKGSLLLFCSFVGVIIASAMMLGVTLRIISARHAGGLELTLLFIGIFLGFALLSQYLKLKKQ